MVRSLKSQDIPEAAKTTSVDVFDADGVRTGARDVSATYFWQTPDGDSFVSQASAREKGMFDFPIQEVDAPPISVPTIQVNKYSIEGRFLGGPWRIRSMA